MSSPRECVERAAHVYGRGLVMTTSFGTQSAVLLHLATAVVPNIPVVWIDTGYLPAETYRYAERLTERLGLNLQVYQSEMSPARMEALHGRLYDADDPSALRRYNRMRKVEPLRRAMRDLGATAWLTGIRAEQTDHRARSRRVTRQWGIVKLHPLLGMTRAEVERYLRVYALPRHPLEEAGYATVGDRHSSRPLAAGETDERATRFHGMFQECGIHLDHDDTDTGSPGRPDGRRFGIELI
jgi:phosphoadenosine phosphosulfate reductase